VADKRGPKVRVVLLSERRALAEALALAISQEDSLLASAMDLSGRPEPGPPTPVVVVDMGSTAASALATIRRIRDAEAGETVLALSAEDDQLRARALEAGAGGFLSEGAPLSEIIEGVLTAAEGGPLIDQREAARLHRLLRRQRHQEATERQRASRLTPRQTQILQLMADGLPGKEVAALLGIRYPTLRTHLQNALTRLGAHSKAEAIALAIRHGRISTG
jgi:two-component system nitrate/nitrite response regulator NarL